MIFNDFSDASVSRIWSDGSVCSDAYVTDFALLIDQSSIHVQ